MKNTKQCGLSPLRYVPKYRGSYSGDEEAPVCYSWIVVQGMLLGTATMQMQVSAG